MPQTDDLLSLRGTSQLQLSYHFHLLDQNNEEIGEVHPSLTTTPTITHDTTRFIQRTMDNFILPPDESADVNYVSDRVAPAIHLEDGSHWSLGVFLFTETSRPQYSYGTRVVGTTVVDQGYILDHPLDHAVSIEPGQPLRQAIVNLILEAGITSVSVESGTALAGQPMSWPPGTNRSQVLSDICLAGGFLPPYFNSAGQCIVQTIFDVDDDKRKYRDTNVVYREGENIYRDSIVESDDLLRAPNRYVVIGTNPNDQPVFGVYDVPAGAPYSAYRRGFVVPTVRDQQGLASNSDAFTAARAWGISESVYEYVTFNSPPNPLHDAYTIVEFGGERWLELSWSLTMTAAGPMTHQLRKVYT